MKVTVIVDNAVPFGTRQPFLAEHGLSLLIGHAGKKILYRYRPVVCRRFQLEPAWLFGPRSWTCWW